MKIEITATERKKPFPYTPRSFVVPNEDVTGVADTATTGHIEIRPKFDCEVLGTECPFIAIGNCDVVSAVEAQRSAHFAFGGCGVIGI